MGGALTGKELAANLGTVENIRCGAGSVLAENFVSLQRFRQYYDFLDVDVDRYVVDGRPRVLAISCADRAGSTVVGRPDVAEPSPLLHPRLRRRRIAGGRDDHRWPAAVHLAGCRRRR